MTTEPDLLAVVPTETLIGGTFRPARAGKTLPVEDPATQERLVDVADAGAEDAVAALDAAVRAQDSWARTSSRERAELLRRVFDAMITKTEDFALLITLEMGKPLAEARAEVAYAAEFFRWFSEQASHLGGTYRPAPTGDTRLLTHKQPVGPCLLITPWNFPLAMGTRKIGAALAAGCTAVVKPSELTPLSMLLLGKLLGDVGLPDGVVNIVTGSDAGSIVQPLMADARLRKVSFTGSTPVGRILLKAAADNIVRSSMELGGNAALIVFEDADLEKAVAGTVAAKMRNGGESCVAANRIYVHADVHDEFTARLSEAMSGYVLGRGTDQGVTLGPLINERQRSKVDALVAKAVEDGAKVEIGGSAPGRPGYFFSPTVLTDVPDRATVRTEEIFGPVAAISTFTDTDDVVRRANDTEYGLVGFIFTEHLSRAIRVGEALQTGMVGINQGVVSNPAGPFGGIKGSGLGREGGDEGILEYLDTKYMAVAL